MVTKKIKYKLYVFGKKGNKRLILKTTSRKKLDKKINELHKKGLNYKREWSY